MDIERVGQPERWIDGHRRGHPTEHPWPHARAVGCWWRPHVVLRHHRLGETNEAAVLAIVNVCLPDLAGTYHAGNHVAMIVLDIDQDRRGGWIEIPHIVRDVLEVAGIFAAIEIKRYKRFRVEIVAWPNRTVETWRRVADHEVDALRRGIDGPVLPDRAA